MAVKLKTKRTPKRKDEDIIAELLPKKLGNISAVARTMKVSRRNVYRVINATPELQEILQDSRERLLDDAEDSLGKAVRKREAWAVCFALKTVGQDRGYIEKTQTELTGTLKTESVVVLPKEEEEDEG